MSASPRTANGPFQMTGVWLFGDLSLVLGVGKLMGLWGGSWWRMALPILVFIVFNGFYISMGFLYLTVQPVREQPAEEESDLLGRHQDELSYGSGLVFVVGLVASLISRLEGVQTSDRWWLMSGWTLALIVLGYFWRSVYGCAGAGWVKS